MCSKDKECLDGRKLVNILRWNVFGNLSNESNRVCVECVSVPYDWVGQVCVIGWQRQDHSTAVSLGILSHSTFCPAFEIGSFQILLV